MTADGVRERLFTVDGVPGVLWTPASTQGCPGLVLLGHGGGHHKRAPGLVARAHRYVTACGLAVAAIDAPGFGERPKTARDEEFIATVRGLRAAGEPVGPRIARYNAGLAAQAVDEWRATLDALLDALPGGAAGPVGYWGVSLGTAIGVRLAAAEPRISAAVFGLAGQETLADAAAKVTIPVEFLLQWDDELVARDSGLALFGAFASREKTLHANVGGHADVPVFEVESSVRFFTRHLSRRSSLRGVHYSRAIDRDGGGRQGPAAAAPFDQWSPNAGSRCTRPFHARGSAAHPGSAGWHAPPPRRPASRTPVRSPRHGSLGPPPPSPSP